MRVRLLAFASASDALGAAERDLELAPGDRVGDLKRVLLARFPALAPLLPRLAIAVDGEVAGDDRVLAGDAEVALLPPVSGG
jgi:molybdopterin converting factor small subunit